ncbi:DnrO protein OS=Afipia felis OX=1035 GN=BN961_03141 PE=4 SV=1 [Afipia felis]
MFTTKHFSVAALAVSLALSVPASAATEHAHGGHDGTALELTLNNGQKWPTDEVLRRGMDEMRSAIERSLGRIHAGQFTSADYVALADRLQQQVDFVTANCKLPEEADAQLHIVLAEILEGMGAMKNGSDRLQGALRTVLALEAYGRHFDHPNWTPVKR